MVLGTSDVHLIDMVRAFAEVDNKGAMVVPYAIEKVAGPDNKILYQHTPPENRVLVAPWVAAEMTDLLQTAVNTGTGRAAQIGRPVAGKTGTTSTSRDGWFLGFSSGLTTGVWMGRDDAKPNPGLYGGRAPAHAFADYMKEAVATRPVEQFDTQVTLPEWQLEPDDEAYYGQPDSGVPTIDANGQQVQPGGGQDGGDQSQPMTDPGAYQQQPSQQGGGRRQQQQQDDDDWQGPPPPPQPSGQRLDQNWLNGVLGRKGGNPQQQQQSQPRD
jgi:penicillin-binding protein 1A